MRSVSAGHYVIGMEGLALLRSWLTGDREQARCRVQEITEFVAAPDQPPLSIEIDAPEADVVAGYARWAANYDSSPNALIEVEQPAVRALIDGVAPGIAL